MQDYRKTECRLSKNIIGYICQKTKDKYGQIAEKLDVSPSYISKVANGHRTLGLNHLLRLEERYSIPLPQLILEIIKEEDTPEKIRPVYRSMKRALEAGKKLEELIRTVNQAAQD
jgi:transcriptional regulator with XRE-family HTH domain